MTTSFNSNVFPIGIAVVIIVSAIIITAVVQDTPDKTMSQIITVGPVWTTDSWLCTSDADFMVHGTIRGITGSLLEINISKSGTQSLYALEEGQMESFSVGVPRDQQIIISRTGTVTGFITIQTVADAEASCVPL